MTPSGAWTVSRVAKVVIAGDSAYGIEAVDAYDPFALYRSAEESRAARLPPHLVLADLQRPRRPKPLTSAGRVVLEKQLKAGSETCDRKAVAAFLSTYGWPTEASGARLPENSRKSAWLEMEATNADELWEPVLDGRHVLAPPVVTRYSDEWKRIRLDEFAHIQEEFAFTERLLADLRSSNEFNLREVFVSVVCFPVGVVDERLGVQSWPILALLQDSFGPSSLPPQYRKETYWRELQKQLLKRVQDMSADTLFVVARDIVTKVFPRKLKHVTPVLEVAEDQHLACSWNCENLLEAIYVMLFLDVEYRRRVLRCEGCGSLFTENKTNVEYCSDRCGNRVRVRRNNAVKKKI